jgi:penicillin-binding protein 1A
MKLNPVLKKAGITAGIVLAAFLLALGIYTFRIYLDFLSNRNLIFGKIEDFSKAMGKNSETDFYLGMEESESLKKSPSVIYDRNGNIIAKFTSNRHKLIPLQEIPYFVTKGFMLIEDQKFYSHHGINYSRVLFLLLKNAFTFGRSGGGSTISQQLAKILFTKQDRSFKRKIYELFCTFELEKRFTKNEILQIYLNSIYLGHGVYGIQNAAGFYFGKSAGELNLPEAALLIGMNRSPERYSPIRNKEAARYIQKVVMNEFISRHFTSRKDADTETDKFWKRFDEYGAFGTQSFWKTDINMSGYATEVIRQILERDFTYEKITSGGLKIETSIDLDRQNTAEQIVREQVRLIREQVKAEAEKTKKEAEYPDKIIRMVESSLVSIDWKTGEVLAVVGGSGYSFANQFNRAISARRQIGSSVKPFIYGTALNIGKIRDQNINPFTKFKDDIFEYTINGKKYKPRNYSPSHQYGSMVSLHDALKKSLNTIAVEVLNDMTIEDVAGNLRDAAYLTGTGDEKRVPAVLSLALGTCELSPMELAGAYSIFPRGGTTVYPFIIRKITGPDGYVYYDQSRENNEFLKDIYPPENRESKIILRPEISYEVVQMMKSVFEKGGTGYYSAQKTGYNGSGYGKSGTSQNWVDEWFAGYTPRETLVVWTGIDNNQSLLIPGSSTSAVIWCEYAKRFQMIHQEQLTVPENMKLLRICDDSQLMATPKCPRVRDFYFALDGNYPEPCYIHQSGESLTVEENP